MAVSIFIVDLASGTTHIRCYLNAEGTCIVNVMPVWPKWRLAEAGREVKELCRRLDNAMHSIGEGSELISRTLVLCVGGSPTTRSLDQARQALPRYSVGRRAPQHLAFFDKFNISTKVNDLDDSDLKGQSLNLAIASYAAQHSGFTRRHSIPIDFSFCIHSLQHHTEHVTRPCTCAESGW
jgi:hypothetical protein